MKNPRARARPGRPTGRTSPVPQALLRLIQEKPGITMTQLVQGSGVSWATVYHHLGILREERLVKVMGEGRERRVIPHGQPVEAVPPVLRATRRRVAEVLVRLGRSTLLDLATAAEVSQRVLYYHLKVLSAQGLARRERRHAAPTPRLVELIEKGGPGGEQ